MEDKKKQKSRLDSSTQQSGVNGQPKIGKNEYEAEILKLASTLPGKRVPTKPLRGQIGT